MTGGGVEQENSPTALRVGLCESFAKTVSESDVYLFAGITGDLHGLHVDEEFAAATRFGHRIAHGALLVGFISTVMSRVNSHIPPPGGVSARYEVDFVAPVFIGDTITTHLTVERILPERGEVFLIARSANQRGELVLEGRALMRVPRSREVVVRPAGSEDGP